MPTSPPAVSLGCAAQLGLSLTDVSGAGGRSFATYNITNNGAVACRVPQPTVSYLNSAGATVGQAVQSGAAAEVNLAPRSVAAFMISDTSCPQPATATMLVADLPGAAAPLTLNGQYQVCSPEVTTLTSR